MMFILPAVTTVQATTITENIEYLGYNFSIQIPLTNITTENITNGSVSSGGEFSDLTVEIRKISSSYFFDVISNDISGRIDYTFTNDTKYYEYIVENETDSVSVQIRVDYSSLEVPLGDLEKENLELMAEIDNLTANLTQKAAEIESLNTTINNLETLLNESNATIAEKEQQIQNLQSQIDTLQDDFNTMKSKYQDAQAEVDSLSDDIDDLNNQIDNIQQIMNVQSTKIDSLESKLDAYQTTTDHLSSPFAISYTDPNGENKIHLNLVWLIIGGFIFSIITFVYIKSNSFSSGKTIRDIGNKFNIPFISSGEKPTPEEWDMLNKSDQPPSIEKDFLNDVKERKTQNKVDSDDKEESEVGPEEVPEDITGDPYPDPEIYDPDTRKIERSKKSSPKRSRKSSPKKPKPEPNYWDTPEGQKHLESLKEQNAPSEE